MGSQTSLNTSQRGGCNPLNSPPGSASVMLDSVSIVLTPLVTVYMTACMEELIIVYCTGLPTSAANPVKYQKEKFPHK